MKSHQRKHLNVLIVSVLIVAMVCTSVPLTVFAEGNSSLTTNALARQKSFPTAGKHPVELTGRRTTRSKEFLNPDGSFTVESYSEPVHYRDTKGLLAEIDNQLVAASDSNFQFENKANSFQVAFATGLTQGNLVRIAKDDEHWLAFSPAQTIRQAGQLTSAAKSQAQTMQYELDAVTELRYTLGQNRLKEEIVLSSYPGVNEFKFNLITKGLSYQLGEDGLYRFVDEQGTSLFCLEQPFAIDAKENATTAVKISINSTSAKGQAQLVVSVDDQWLKQAAYPVIIEPSVIEDTDSPRNCWDTFAASLHPNSNYYTLPYIIAGYHSTYGTNKAYVRWETLPSLPVGADINKVELRLNMYMDFTDQTTVQVKQITSPWNLTALTWNNQPSVGTKVIHSQTGNAQGSWDFDITSLAKKWYEGTTENYGIQLAANPENANRRSFRSSNHTADRPVLRITYTLEPMGLQSFWGYAGNTNVLNGNLVVSATDATLPGRGVPIGVSRTYNSRSTEASTLGYGWTSNVDMHLTYTDGSSVKLVDGTGSSYYFTLETDGTYKPPVGIYYELTKASGLYVLKDDAGVKYYFDSDGQLDKIVDPQGNTTDIVRDADGLISHVVDPSKRYIEFNYTGTAENRRLSDITMNATPGSYPSSPANEPVVSYTYDPAGNLATVTKVNEGENVVVSFDYTEHKLARITDPLGAVTEISYSDNRVETITRQLDGATSGILAESGHGTDTNKGVDSVSTHFAYQPRGDGQIGYAMVTTVTDPRGIKTVYYSSAQGNVEKIVKNPGPNEEKYEMQWGDMQELLAIKDPKGKDTVMGYDTQGNMLSLRNPAGASSIYQYNADGDVISASDFAGRSITISYDDKRQVVVSTNHQSASSATGRDSHGNVSSETIPMTLAENLLVNSGFESWAGSAPTGWQNVTPAPGTVTNDANNRVNGNRSVKIQGVADSGSGYGRLLQTEYVPVQALGRYAVSWWVKTNAMGAAGAGLLVHWYDGAKAWRSATPLLEPVSGTTDWTRQVTMVDAPANAVYARLELRMKSPGTAWYDNAQLEGGSAVNAANMLTNAGFEVNQDNIPHLPDGWWSNTLTEAEGVTTAEKRSGNNSVVVNTASSGRNFGLGVDTTGESVNGVAGTAVTFSGWVKTANLTSATRAQLRLKLVYADDSLGWFDAFSTSGSHDWEYVENTVVLPKDVSRWAVYGWVPSTSDRGKVYFDDFSLRIYGSSSSFASDYNMLTNSSFEVDADGSKWPDNWSKAHDSKAGTYDIAWVGAAESGVLPYTGSKMVRIRNTPSWVTLGNNNFERLKAGSTYTATAMTMADKVTSGGAAIKFDVYSESTLIGQYRSETLIGTTDWQKLSVSYSTEEIKSQYPAATHIQYVAQARGATAGTIYFDAMRMSEKATVTNYSYDTAGNYLQDITNPLGKKVTLTVDKHGNPLTVTDPKQNVTKFTYDDLDALKTVQNAHDLLTEYSYDQVGNLLSVTQKDGLTLEALSTTSSVYNELGLVTQVIDPMNQITEYRYDQNGNLVYIKTASGKEAWLTYDTYDRLATVQYLYQQAGQMLVFSYDKNGNRTSVVHKTGNLADPDNMVLQERYSYSYEYDALNRASRVMLPTGRTVNYTYNPASQVTSIGNSQVSTTKYSYDYTGLNTTVNEDISGTSSYIYDELGRITKATRGKSGVALTTHVQYDAIGQITRYLTVSNSGIVAEHVYQYDENGNRIKDQRFDGSYVVYEYDQVNQLVAEEYFSAQDVSEKRINYTYSLQGNRLAKEVFADGNTVTTTYGYNAANELINIDGKTISSEDGNQLHTGSNSLEFNALGQLLKVYTADGQQLMEQYEYNADGLRVAKLDGSGNVLEQYIYNGSKLAYVTDGNDEVLYYFSRNASGSLLSFVDCTGEEKVAYWYATDAHGNVVGLTNAAGELVVTYAYDAWGNELSSTGTVTTANGAQLLKDANPFRYSGYYYDQVTRLYYLNARYYSPELGRFLSRDPVPGGMGEPLRLNLYTYALNNPVILDDPDGTDLALLAGFGFAAGKMLVGIGAAFGAVLSSPVTLTALAVGTAVVGARVYQATRAKTAVRDFATDIPEIERGRTAYYQARRAPYGSIRLEGRITFDAGVILCKNPKYEEGVWTLAQFDALKLGRVISAGYPLTLHVKEAGKHLSHYHALTKAHIWFGK